MKRFPTIVFALAAMLALTGCGENGLYSLCLITNGEHVVKAGEVLRGPLIVMGGEITLEEASQVSDATFILGGDVQADGELSRDVSIIGGILELGPDAKVGGDLNVGGGTVNRSPKAEVSGVV